MNTIIAWAERALFPPIKILHLLGNIVIFALMLMTVADVVGRKLAGAVPLAAPVRGSYELTEFALIIIIFCSVGYTQLRRGHISINIITSRLSARAQAIMNATTTLMGVVLFAFVAWQSIVYAGRLYDGGNVSAVLLIPQYPFAIIVAVGSIIFCISMLFTFMEFLAAATKREGRNSAEVVKDVA